MNPICRILSHVVCLFSLFSASLSAQEVTLLESGKSIERTIAGGQTHVYRITLQAGQFVHFDVQQTSCDVALTLTAPDGQKRETNFTPFGLPETLSDEIATAGEYQLTVRSLDFPKMSGAYRVQVTLKSVAESNNKKRIEAERLLLELRGNLPAAQRLEKAQQLLTLWRELGERFWESQAQGQIANAYSQQQNWANAIKHTEITLAICRELQLTVGEALNLQSLGNYYGNQGQRDKAIAHFVQARELFRATKAKMFEYNAISQLGFQQFNKGELEPALSSFEQAQAIGQEIGYPDAELNFSSWKARIKHEQKNYTEAQRLYETTLSKARESTNKTMEAFTLKNLGDLYNEIGQSEKAAETFHQAMVVHRGLGNRVADMNLLRSLATAYGNQKQPDKAIETLNQALTLSRELRNRAMEAFLLDELGYQIYFGKGNVEIALAYHEQSLPIMREVGNRFGELLELQRIGLISLEDGKLEKSLTHYEAALLVARELKDVRQGVILNRLGELYLRVGEKEKARTSWEQAIEIGRSFNREISVVLGNLCNYYLNGEENIVKALTTCQQTLAASQAEKNYIGINHAYFHLSEAHRLLGEYDKAMELMNQAMASVQDFGRGVLNNKEWESKAYFSQGRFYYFLGHYDKAAQAAEKGIKINEEQVLENRRFSDEGYQLLGRIYQSQGNYEKAIEIHQNFLKLSQKFQKLNAEATAYQLLGSDYIGLGQPETAIEHLEKAFALVRKHNFPSTEIQCQLEYGNALFGLKKYSEANSYHQRALLLSRQFPVGKPYEAPYYEKLMRDWRALGDPTVAVFYGKQAVNSYQEVRSSLQPLEKALQQSFLRSKEQTYRDLADLLITQARLPEAEQVIRMLKQEEYFEYIRRDMNNASTTEKASLTPEEAALDKRYREIADQLTTIGAERSTLLEKKERTPEENQRLAKLEADLSIAAQQFDRFLNGLAAEMNKNKDGIVRFSQVSDAQGLQTDLRELGKGVAALYTVVGEDKYSVILTTADVQKAYQVSIKAADLNRKILAFRTVLQNPKLDPLPLAQELYKILLAPVEKDLRAMKAETLMWSLDGVLRYVPMTALHDGEKYLIERYRHTVFTPVSNARLKDTPSRNWQALGLGVTKTYGADIPALPGVAEEMQGIIKTGTNGKGVLPGTIMLDEQFTQEAMLTGLRERKAVVHVASHFRFKPGNETDSALLLGDGNFLSLAQIKTMTAPFDGVELLTLSACNTATGGSGANGKEIEGFGALAQKKGAKAVVASLWPVADRSTKTLMQEFYQRREAQADITKVEALRQAQIKLMQGELVTTVALTQREIVHETNKATNQPAYKADPKKPYAHPYYWAPFILIGNWK